MPVLGYLVRFALALMRLPHLVRSHQRVEATFNAAVAHLEATAAAERKRQTFTMRLVADEFAARAKAESLSLERITASVASLAAEVGRSADTAREHRQQLSQFAERVGDLQRTLDEEIAERKARERSASLDSQFYVALEDHFRGTREEIKRRVAEHLPLIRAALGGDMDATVLDVGCGRGEWIEVLLENGLSARGVDSGTAMVEACTRRGFVVSQADALEHLQSLPAESLGAITAFHLIEHLPFPQLSALIREMHRVLRPGGLILLETPNPENLIVGACNFWYDPTHLKPLPPELMMFLCSACGFSDVDIQRLHPFPPERHLSGCDRQVVGRLNELMYGWQDYAVVGRKR
jgi:O-antigen chain-terminating methyltransferase